MRDLRLALRYLLKSPRLHARRRRDARGRDRREQRDLQRRLRRAAQAAADRRRIAAGRGLGFRSVAQRARHRIVVPPVRTMGGGAAGVREGRGIRRLDLAHSCSSRRGETTRLALSGVSAVVLRNLRHRCPSLGRSLQPDDEAPGAPRVVVLSHSVWTRVFGGGSVDRRDTDQARRDAHSRRRDARRLRLPAWHGRLDARRSDPRGVRAPVERPTRSRTSASCSSSAGLRDGMTAATAAGISASSSRHRRARTFRHARGRPRRSSSTSSAPCARRCSRCSPPSGCCC